MSASKKKKDEEGKDPPRPGTTDPADARLAEWIARQWRREEKPTRIEAYRMEKVKGVICREGVAAYSRTFKNTETVDIDNASKIANEVIGDCQAHCDAHLSQRPGPTTYNVVVSDSGRSSNARNEVAERPIQLYPQRIIHQPTEASARAQAGGDDEDEDGTANGALRKTLAVMAEREQWRVETENTVVGEILTMAKDQWKEIHTAYMALTAQHVALLHRTRELDILDKDHEPARVEAMAMASLKKEGVEALKEGVKVVKYLVMGAGSDKGSGDGTTALARQSLLQLLVREFIGDCEKADIDQKLFGRAEGGKIVEPGIFNQAQCELLARVAEGKAPDSELEGLIPDSGKPVAVTQEQYLAAEPVLKTAGLADAIKIVLGHCVKNRAARQKAAEQARTQADASTT